MSQNRVPTWVNRMMKFTLRSPFHGSVSQSIMLLTFKGRKSGKTYTTPVRYVRAESRVTCFTREPWWKNLQAGAPVTLRLKGRDVNGVATPITDDNIAITTSLQHFLSEFPSDAKFYNVKLDTIGKPMAQDIHTAAQSTIMIRIQI